MQNKIAAQEAIQRLAVASGNENENENGENVAHVEHELIISDVLGIDFRKKFRHVFNSATPRVNFYRG